jgi:hypothetical protein
VSFVTRRAEFLQGNAGHRPTEFLDLSNHPIEFGLTKIDLRHDACDRPAMSGDDNGLAALDRVEQAWQTRLGFGGLDFADQSDRLV